MTYINENVNASAKDIVIEQFLAVLFASLEPHI